VKEDPKETKYKIQYTRGNSLRPTKTNSLHLKQLKHPEYKKPGTNSKENSVSLQQKNSRPENK
jgi:hypothetical protein